MCLAVAAGFGYARRMTAPSVQSRSPIVGRFAPSPTGIMHLGNVWTALLAWLSVRSQGEGGGRILLRIEDLDRERSRPEYARRLMDDLRWLGLDWDLEPVFQSGRTAAYEAALARLAARGLTYPCVCTRKELRALGGAPQAGDPVDAEPAYPGTCLRREGDADRPAAVRLRVPDAEYGFEDGRLGRVGQNLAQECGDFVLRRADGMFAYQLAVVVDDAEQGVTEVLRGEDLAGSTPRQLYLYELLGAAPPKFIHVPLLVDEAGVRLSKRQKSADLGLLRDRGARPEAIAGLLAFKANLTGVPRPVTPRELVAGFDLARLPQEPVVMTEAEMAGLFPAS